MFKNIGKKIKSFVLRKIRGIFLVNVNYGLSLESVNGLTHVDPAVKRCQTDLQKESNAGQKEVCFRIFRRYTSSEKAKQKMLEKGCRPATFVEFLSVISSVEKIPRRHRERALVALGSFCEDLYAGKRVVALVGNKMNRDLILMKLETKWPRYFRFLAVYEGKSPSPT